MTQVNASASPLATAIWLIAAGFVGAMIFQSPEGIVVGAVVGYLIAQMRQLQGHVTELLHERDVLRRKAMASQPVQDSRAQTAGAARSVPSHADKPQIVAAAKEAESVKIKPTAQVSEPTKTVKRQNPFDKLLAAVTDWFKEGNPLARVGIVVMFFGGAFLAKYSADAGLFPLELRFVALTLGALVLLALGWRLRSKNAVYAQVLQGGGIAGLYLTIFTAFKLFQLLPPTAAFGVMVLVTMTAAVLAVLQDALSLAVLGMAGGFLAPILTSTGEGSHIALFSYYSILNLGIFVVAWFRSWQVLNLVGFVSTFAVASAFRVFAYTDEDWMSTDGFLLLFFVMYVGVSILFAIRQPVNLKGYVSGSLVFGLPIITFGLHASLVNHIPYALAWSAAGFGFFYAVLSLLLYLSSREFLRLLCEAFAALSIIFSTLVIPLAFDEQTTSALWAIEGAGLLWLGIRQNRLLARLAGLLLQAVAAAAFVWGFQALEVSQALFNPVVLGALVLSATGLFSGHWLNQAQSQLKEFEKESFAGVLAFWSFGWWLFAGLIDIHRFVSDEYLIGLWLGYFSATAMLFHSFCARLRWPLIGQLALGVMPVAALMALMLASGNDRPSNDWGLLGWPVFVAAGYYLLWRFEGAKERLEVSMRDWQHAMYLWLFAGLAIWEGQYWVRQYFTELWSALLVGLVLVAFVWIAARPLAIWPFTAHLHVYRIRGAFPLLILALGWLGLTNFEHDGDPSPLPFVPLLNPLELMQMLVMFTAFDFWRRLDNEQRDRVWVAAADLRLKLVAAVLFVWLNTVLVRTLHHYFDVPWDMNSMAGSLLVQACLSIFWTLLGLSAVVYASRKAQRELWLMGAGLMAVVVVKLFVVDLAGSGSLERIVTFLSVGAIILFAGYVSPLPPGKTGTEADEQGQKTV